MTLGNSAVCSSISKGVLTGTSQAKFDFGAKLCDSATGTAGDNVVISVQVVVANIPANVNGVTIPVQAQFVYGNGIKLVASTNMSIVEPSLQLKKNSSIALVGGDHNDDIMYTLIISHTGISTSHAYGLILSDIIPATLSLVASSVSASVGQVSSVNNTLQFAIDSFPSGSVATITYTAALVPSVLAGNLIVNHASMGYLSAPNTATQMPNAARVYNDSTSAEVMIGVPILHSFIVYNKTLNSRTPDLTATPPVYYFAVGEVVTFHLVASIPNQPTPFVNLVQQIPLTSGQFQILSVNALVGSSVTIDSSATNIVGDNIWYNFTKINNPLVGENEGGTVTLEVQVVVADVITNVASATPTTTGSLVSQLANSTRAITLSIVEATINATTTATTLAPTYVEAGNVVAYTISISHAVGSSTSAYNLSIADTLSSFVSLSAGSVKTSAGSVVEGNTAGDTRVVVSVGELGIGGSILNITLSSLSSPPSPIYFI